MANPLAPRGHAAPRVVVAPPFEVDLQLYGEDAVHAAVYRYAALGAVVTGVDWTLKRANVSFSKVPEADLPALEENFRQELTDQVLRIKIRLETEAVRNLILANAFSDSALAQD